MVKKLEVEGIAVVEGLSRNKVMYQAQELHKFAPTLIGRPILKDHVNLTDNTIGKVTYAESIENGKKVKYKGWITDEKTIEKIEDGRISNVSIGAQAGKMVKEKQDSDYIIAKEMTALELSTTPVPGVPDASIFKTLSKQKESLDDNNEDEIDFDEEIEDDEMEEMVKRGINDLNESLNLQSHSQLNLKKEEINMEGNGVKENSQVTEDAKLTEMQAQLAAANKVIESYKAAERTAAVEAYTKLCAEKGIAAQDVTSASMETIKAFTAMVESIKLPKVEEKKEDAAVKEQAKTKVVEKSAAKADESVKTGYVIEYSDLSGVAFYKSY